VTSAYRNQYLKKMRAAKASAKKYIKYPANIKAARESKKQ